MRHLTLLVPWLAVVSVCGAATLPYFSTVGAYFIGDDFGLVQLFSHKPALHYLTLFWTPWTEQIYGTPYDELRPLVAASYQLDALGGAASPILYHLTNLLLHVGCALLVVGIARSVCRLGWPASAFAGVVFAMLPSQAETVAWISGRADSIPTLLYLASFLAYAGWQQGQSRPFYFGAVGLFFLALFSKQSAITMPMTVMLYDTVREKRWVLGSWSSTARYVPFALLTACYLVLRLVLFGNAIREDQITSERLVNAALLQWTHLRMLVLGSYEVETTGLRPLLVLAGLGLALLLMGFLWLRNAQPQAKGAWTWALYFGPVWWLISVAPLTVTYVSARHLYLASAGMAVLVALSLDAVYRRAVWLERSLVVVAGAGLIVWLGAMSGRAVEEWNYSASISQGLASDVRREASVAPPGSLVILDAPASNYGRALTGPSKGTPTARTWIWSWALPFALQPPFAPFDLTTRVSMVEVAPEISPIYCCSREEWFAEFQKAVGGWARQIERPPAIALLWDGPSGSLRRISSAEDPSLAAAALGLAGAQTPDQAAEGLDLLVHGLR